jgi:2-keto-3-deoxy-L-rhamnonate aldolase RhmA
MNDPSDARSWKNPNAVSGAAAARVADALTLGRTLRGKAASGLALGSFVIDCPAPATVTALALAGFDFAVLDMEHSAIDLVRLEGLLAAAQVAGLPAIVRPWNTEAGLIGKILDLGAHGIMAPHVDSAAQARSIVEQCRYPPRGSRGVCPLSKYDALAEPLRMLDESVYVILQIEGRSGIERIADIADVPGIDALFVGPYDLAMSLGVAPGSAQVFEAAGRLSGSVTGGPALGIYLDDPHRCGDWVARRFALQVVSFDGRLLADAARGAAAAARASARKDPA